MPFARRSFLCTGCRTLHAYLATQRQQKMDTPMLNIVVDGIGAQIATSCDKKGCNGDACDVQDGTRRASYQGMKRPIMMIVAGFLLTGFAAGAGKEPAARSDEDLKAAERAEQFEKAGQNRLWAASTQMSHAETLLASALDLRKKGFATEAERTWSLGRAGDSEQMAGGLVGMAIANLDRAVDNFGKAAAEYAKLKDEERRRNAEHKADLARRDVTAACVKAAEAYETAAEAYSAENANDPVKAGQVIEWAAGWRENLAGRR